MAGARVTWCPEAVAGTPLALEYFPDTYTDDRGVFDTPDVPAEVIRLTTSRTGSPPIGLTRDLTGKAEEAVIDVALPGGR